MTTSQIYRLVILCISAFVTTCSILTIGPTFSLIQATIRENSIYLIFAHVFFSILYITPSNKKSSLSFIHLFFAITLSSPALHYVLPQRENKTHEETAPILESFRIAFGNDCILEPSEFSPLLSLGGIETERRTTITVATRSTDWEPQVELLSSLDLPSRRFKSTRSGIMVDVINLPSPNTADQEYLGRIGLRRLAGELRNNHTKRILIGGIAGSLFSERIKMIRSGSKLHEVGWHTARFINPVKISPFIGTKLGYDGVWLSRDITADITSWRQCKNANGIELQFEVYERLNVLPEPIIESLIATKD